MKQSVLLSYALPWLLIFVGICVLNMLPIYVGGGLIILGIVMLVERIWPEHWESEDIDQS